MSFQKYSPFLACHVTILCIENSPFLAYLVAILFTISSTFITCHVSLNDWRVMEGGANFTLKELEESTCKEEASKVVLVWRERYSYSKVCYEIQSYKTRRF